MSKAGPPRNMEELAARQLRNSETTGYGLDVAQHLPCPFCGAADFMVSRLVELALTSYAQWAEGATCRECGRSAAMPVERSADGVRMEVVQTGGPDQPGWLEPKMRRADR